MSPLRLLIVPSLPWNSLLPFLNHIMSVLDGFYRYYRAQQATADCEDAWDEWHIHISSHEKSLRHAEIICQALTRYPARVNRSGRACLPNRRRPPHARGPRTKLSSNLLYCESCMPLLSLSVSMAHFGGERLAAFLFSPCPIQSHTLGWNSSMHAPSHLLRFSLIMHSADHF